MDIAVARTFLEVVKTGSFVNAAAVLNITQTAVSARIRVLEEQLERPVFVRSKSGAKLTPEGEQFLRYATTLVQIWESARKAVALPPGRETVVTIGAELSLWNPLLKHWLLWMRRECPDVAVRAEIGPADRLMERVQEGTLDVAVLYGAPQRTGVVTELLFEEKLVLVRTANVPETFDPATHVRVDWGPEFAAGYQAAFPDQDDSVFAISYGPLALEYILAAGGSGYFRKGFVRPWLERGELMLVADSPEFSYSAYLAHSTKASPGVMSRIREGLRAAVAVIS